jgi:hypothetical protein
MISLDDDAHLCYCATNRESIKNILSHNPNCGVIALVFLGLNLPKQEL